MLLPGLAAAAAPALEDMIPADADMVLLVDDVPGLLRDWPNLPLARAWSDPAVQDLLQGFAGDGEVPELPVWLQNPGDDEAAETDPHARLVRSLTGQIAIIIDMESFSETGGDGEDSHRMPTGVVILAQVDGNEDTITALLTVPEAVEGAEGEAGADDAGEDVLPFALPEGTWTVANGVLVVSASPEETAAQVALLAGETEVLPLSSGDGFQAMRRHSAAGGIEMLVNLEVLVAKLTAELASGEAAFADNPMGVTPQAMLDGLGLDVFRAGWLSLRPAPEATDMTYGLTFSEERGVVRMLAFEPLPGDRRLPLPDSAVDATAFAYDLPGAWQAMTEILTQVSPAMGAAMEAQIAQMSAQMGIDLVKEIPGAFAGEFATATFMDEAAAGQGITLAEYEDHLSQVWVATLREGHRMGEALQALTPMMGAAGITQTTRTVEGKVLNVISVPDVYVEDGVVVEDEEGDGPVFAWSVGEKYLVAVKGSIDDLIMVMNGLEKGGRGIWGDADVKALMQTLPAGAAAVQYQDSSRMLSGMMSSLLMGAGAGAAGDDNLTADQNQQLSDLIGRLITESIAAMYRSTGELVGQGRVLHGQP